MRRLVALLSVVLAAAVLASTASAGGSVRPRVTLFGDSVAAALAYQGKARSMLAKGLDLRIDAKVCRRLVENGCPYKGDRPASVLSLVEKPSAALGDVVVIDVGYNDDPSAYGDDIDRVMQALVRQGVSTVIWVTMQEKRPLYRMTNAAIRAAAKRWPQINIADWTAASRARSGWFVDDGLHLSSAGALGLAMFLRPLVLASSCTASCMRERRIVDTGTA
jgi:hypothetical protein